MWFTSRVKRFWQWVLRSPKVITIPVTVVLLILISTGIYKGLDWWDYMQHEPEACASCHIMEESYATWATTEHQDVACHSCHQQSIFATASEGIKWAMGVDEIVFKTEVPNEFCVSCHENGTLLTPQIADSSNHQIHSTNENIACAQCHASDSHEVETGRDSCASCHTEKHADIPGTDTLYCTGCHIF